ncbi:CP2K1 protein, partial [Amia calva]|nr:CP2K1 protein [Amia calva]
MATEEGLLQMVSVALLAALLVLVLIHVLIHVFPAAGSSALKAPPGPFPLPIIGNLHQLDLKRPYRSLMQLSKKYGSVFTIHLGPRKVVVLAGYETVKDVLINHAEEFGDRDMLPVFYDSSEGHGVLFANGESWKEMRRFSLSNMRDFGMGRKGSEEKIMEEMNYLSEVFEQQGGKPFDVKDPVNRAVSNIISSIVYGTRFDYDDPVFQAMVNKANERVSLSMSPQMQLYNAFPFLGFLLRDRRAFRNIVKENLANIRGFVRELQMSLNVNDKRGLIDSFLIRQQQESGQEGSHFHELNLIHIVSNLFVAGTDTTSTTLRWGLLLMAKYPHIQEKVQEEISRVIGGRPPRVEDRKGMAYTDAVIHEVQRFANILPLNLPHATSCDVHFQGYFIRKDETQWETPHQFNPGHFLDSEGKLLKRDAFMPFSAGPRACLGESLARMELFLFFTSLLQRFTFTPPPGTAVSELDLTPDVGFITNPMPHQLCAVSRT